MKLFDDFRILVSITVIFLCISFLSSFDFVNPSQVSEKNEKIKKESVENKKNNETLDDGELAVLNGIAIGFDRSQSLTDVMIVAHVDPRNKSLNMISVPRDLKIDFTDPNFVDIKENNPNNQILYCKLNEVYGYLGADDKALEDLISIIEIITGLEIDHVAKIEIDGFKEIVDSIGGVEFDVPMRMYYNDPYQGLYIDLYPGLQVLDGNAAEGLVRFRKGYSGGDITRVGVQQEFIKAMAKQIMLEKDFSKLKNFLTTVYEYVDTDFGLIKAIEYADFFFDVDLDKIFSSDNMLVIPSYGLLIEETWFQVFNVIDSQSAVKELLEKNEEHGKYREYSPSDEKEEQLYEE